MQVFLILMYVFVVAMAASVTLIFTNEAVKVNFKGVLIIVSVVILCILAAVSINWGWWNILGLIATYIIITRITTIIVESSRKNRP